MNTETNQADTQLANSNEDPMTLIDAVRALEVYVLRQEAAGRKRTEAIIDERNATMALEDNRKLVTHYTTKMKHLPQLERDSRAALASLQVSIIQDRLTKITTELPALSARLKVATDTRLDASEVARKLYETCNPKPDFEIQLLSSSNPIDIKHVLAVLSRSDKHTASQ